MVELQVRDLLRRNLLEDQSYFSIKKNIYFDPSLELSHRDSSNEGSQYIILWSIGEEIKYSEIVLKIMFI